MNFMQSYMQLLNNGIFITDENREDKYLEIIESSQEDQPEPLQDDATFEQQQKYLEAEKKYKMAQDNLKILETYLNAYDKLFKIKYVTDVLNEAKTAVDNAQSVEEVEAAVDSYKKKISSFKS